MFHAGSETGGATLTWTVLLLAKYPEIQRKCFQHIKEVWYFSVTLYIWNKYISGGLPVAHQSGIVLLDIKMLKYVPTRKILYLCLVADWKICTFQMNIHVSDNWSFKKSQEHWQKRSTLCWSDYHGGLTSEEHLLVFILIGGGEMDRWGPRQKYSRTIWHFFV